MGGDSALMIIEFKKAGVIISTTSFTFRNASGSIASFTAFSFPLASIPLVPDSMIIAIASSNVAGTGLQSGSWLEIDELAFSGTGITQPIPGGSFDTWLPQTMDKPDNWRILPHGGANYGVSKSTIHYAGSYSMQLTTQPGTGGSGSSNSVECGMITTGHMTPNNGPTGGLPYTHTSDTLTGYYMFAPVGTDTGRISVSLSAGGSYVGGNNHYFYSASTWTYFEMPFNAMSTPDTMRIDIQSGSWHALMPGSVLNVDYLQLKSQPLPPVGVNNATMLSDKVIIYPNPATNVVNFTFDGDIQGAVSIKIYDILGKVISYKSYNVAPSVISLPTYDLSYGMYFYEIANNGTVIRDKFIKE